jgi:hypothetical protein
MDFFSKVFPDEELREYALGRLASFLSGDVSHEHLYIFTGSGSKVQDHRAVRGRIRRVLLQLPTVLTQRRAAAGSALGSSPAPSHVARRAPGARGERAPERGRHEGAVRRHHIICRASTATPSSSDHSSAW